MKFRIDIKSSVEYTQLDCVVAEAELASCSKISDTNLTKFTANFRKEIPALGYLKLNNVYVLGNGLLLDENKKRIRSPFLPYSLLNNESGLRLSSGPIQKETDGKFSTRELSVITIDEPVALLTQPGDRIFGHWLVDILPRLSLLRNIDSPLKYILKNDVLNGSAISDIKEIFKLAEFDTSHAFGLKPVANAYFCKSLIVPSVVRYGQQIHSYVGTLYEPYIKLNHSKCDSPTKVYLSRRKWKGENSRRILENALELENHFIKKGYNVIFPEELSFIEKID